MKQDAVLQKALAIVLVALLVARVMYRPRLRELGKRVDQFVNFMVVAIALSYLAQLVFLAVNSL